MFNCAILGFGTVGSNVARILLEKEEELYQRTGRVVRLKWVLDRHFRREKAYPLPASVKKTEDIADILDDPEVHCIIELIGGEEPAGTFIKQALDRGKHVVTANKAVLSKSAVEIWTLAAKKGVKVGFEASVGGGVPVIKTVREALTANKVFHIVGIMNGTCNYILSRMTEEGLEYGDLLKDAQRLGFAEADPSFDVEGLDTAHKLAILAMLTFGGRCSRDAIYTEGITQLSPLDTGFAKELGYRIKLLAIGTLKNGAAMLRVHPTMIPEGHLMAQVNGAFNAFHLEGDEVGKILLYGMGAGGSPTASAVVADILDIVGHQGAGGAQSDPGVGAFFREISLIPVAELVSRYYFRFAAQDSPGVLAKISGILGKHGISIQSVVQKGRRQDGAVPIVMLTHEAKESHVQAALKEIDSLDVTMAKTVLIRIEDLSSVGCGPETDKE